MEFELLGWPSAEPTLDLDHTQFAYAGKFVISASGKTVVRASTASDGPPDTILGALAFSEDHSDTETVHVRYITVRETHRGNGIGPRLLRYTADLLAERYDSVEIAVNNPIAYEAAYRAGFVNTGTETGIAEVTLRYAPTEERKTECYQAGFDVFYERDLPTEHRAVIERNQPSDPPTVVANPVTPENTK